MKSTGVLDPISQACQVAGCYTISIGTLEPTVVLTRLLSALATLDPEAHRALTAPDGESASIPEEALQEQSSAWWSTETAEALLLRVFGAINAAAPEGFACMLSGDRVELARIALHEDADESPTGPPPHVSALRERVRPRSLKS